MKKKSVLQICLSAAGLLCGLIYVMLAYLELTQVLESSTSVRAGLMGMMCLGSASVQTGKWGRIIMYTCAVGQFVLCFVAMYFVGLG